MKKKKNCLLSLLMPVFKTKTNYNNNTDVAFINSKEGDKSIPVLK